MVVKKRKSEVLSLWEDNGGLVRFLTGIMQKASDFVRHLDSQANILISISSAIFLFSISRLYEQGISYIPLVLLAFFAALSALVGLCAIHPPRFMRKQNQKESIMYGKAVSGFSSADAYQDALRDVLQDREKVLEQYATEIYNMHKYYYRPKRQLFNIARNLLLSGVLLSLLSLLFFGVE